MQENNRLSRAFVYEVHLMAGWRGEEAALKGEYLVRYPRGARGRHLLTHWKFSCRELDVASHPDAGRGVVVLRRRRQLGLLVVDSPIVMLEG